MHSTLSAELHSSSKCRTSSPSSSHGCGSVVDSSTHTDSSEVQTQFPLPVGSDKVTPWDPSSSSALQSSPSWKKPAHRCSPSLTWIDDIYLVGAPEKNAWCHLLTPAAEPWLCQPQAQHQQVLGYKGMHERTEVNKEPKVMKAPAAIGESVKVPLNPKVANTVKAIEKEGH